MFTLRELWRSTKNNNAEFSPDASTTFEIDGQTCVATGDFTGKLRFYFPSKGGESDPYSEIQLQNPILQLECGTYVRQLPSLIILFPNSIAFYEVIDKEKTIVINEAQSYPLSHSCYQFIIANIDGAARPAQLAIMSLDGYLTMLNITGTTSYQIPQFFLPSTFSYIPLLESFIFCTSDYRVICYRKSAIIGAKTIEICEEWSNVIGEQGLQIHFWKSVSSTVTSSIFDIAIVGERMLHVFDENGKLKTMMYLDGCTLASYSYTTNPSPDTICKNLIIANTNSQLSIYVNFQKVWQLVIPEPAISVDVITIESNRGLLSLMSSTGNIFIGYLGTAERDTVELPKLPIITDLQKAQHIEKISNRISQMPTAEHLQVFVNVSRSSSKNIELIFQPSCPLQDVDVCIDVPPTINPISPISIGDMNDKEATYRLELISNTIPPARRNVMITATFTPESTTRLLTKGKEFDLPFEFFVKRYEGKVKGSQKLVLCTTQAGFMPLKEIFPNAVMKEPHVLTLVLNSGDMVSIFEDPKGFRYRIESDNFCVIGFGVGIISKAVKAPLTHAGDVATQPLISVAKEHYELRVRLREEQAKLSKCVKELENYEKAIIVRYEAATPEPLDELNKLLKASMDSVRDTTNKIMSLQNEIRECAGSVEAATYTFLEIAVRSFNMPEKKATMIRKCIPLNTYTETPGWEECMVASIQSLIAKLRKAKSSAIFGTVPEFLNDFCVFESAIESLIQAMK